MNAKIPEEILRSEQKRATPVRPAGPGSLGLPGLPPDILDLVIRYGPMLVLAAGAINGFNAASMFVHLSSSATQSDGLLQYFSALLALAASVGMVLAYVWLNQKRRIGWNLLAFALIIQILGQILVAGSSILYTGVQVLLTAYVMLQVRDSFSG